MRLSSRLGLRIAALGILCAAPAILVGTSADARKEAGVAGAVCDEVGGESAGGSETAEGISADGAGGIQDRRFRGRILMSRAG